jgi:hypothetical protein
MGQPDMSNNKPVSLKIFFLQVALWMPLSFYFWFVWSGLFVAPVELVVDPVMGLVLGDALRDVYQTGYQIMIEIYFTAEDGTRLQLNPMIFGYGLPLLSGLIISTPNSIGRRVLQLLAGWLLISLVQSWGIVWESLHQLQVWVGPEGQALLAARGLSPEVITLGYQFGYLILPAVVPVATWILLNRRFFETLATVNHNGGETPPPDDGQLDRPQ